MKSNEAGKDGQGDDGSGVVICLVNPETKRAGDVQSGSCFALLDESAGVLKLHKYMDL